MMRRNVAWSVLGAVIPMVMAFVGVPFIIDRLGPDRFGLLSLGWIVAGYFSLFDLGLGRALTRAISREIAAGDAGTIGEIFWSALAGMLAMSLAGMVPALLAVPFLVSRVLQVPDAIAGEAELVFYVLGVSIPLTVTGSALRGTLEAFGRFRQLSLLGITIGSLNFLVPLLVLLATRNVGVIVGLLVFGRMITWTVQLVLCLELMEAEGPRGRVDRARLVSLLKSGGWMTISSVISPLMSTYDRFFVAAWLTVAAVTYYATPFDAVTKLLVLPTALAAVVYPAFSKATVGSTAQAATLFQRAVKGTFVIVYPAALILILFAQEGLALWLGGNFPDLSTRVAQILTFGVVFNAVAQIPFALLQGGGFAKLVARIHLLELPVYVVALWLLVDRFGIRGAAAAWTLRVLLDLGLLTVAAARSYPEIVRQARQLEIFALVALVGILPTAAIPASLASKLAYLVLVAILAGGIAYYALLNNDDRDEIRNSVPSPTRLLVARRAGRERL